MHIYLNNTIGSIFSTPLDRCCNCGTKGSIDSGELELIETPDIVATAAHNKLSHQWVVGFALETEDLRFRAIVKMQRKCCDMMVSNGPSAINSLTNEVEILAADGSTIAYVSGDKRTVANAIIQATETLYTR